MVLWFYSCDIFTFVEQNMNLQSIKTTREIETAIIRLIHNSRVSDITYQYQSESFQLSFHGAPSEGLAMICPPEQTFFLIIHEAFKN